MWGRRDWGHAWDPIVWGFRGFVHRALDRPRSPLWHDRQQAHPIPSALPASDPTRPLAGSEQSLPSIFNPASSHLHGNVPFTGVDRVALSRCVVGDAVALKALEGIVHPLVARERHARILAASGEGADAIILDIPLLFETGAEAGCDVTVTVSASAEVQRARVVARPGMTAGERDWDGGGRRGGGTRPIVHQPRNAPARPPLLMCIPPPLPTQRNSRRC